MADSKKPLLSKESRGFMLFYMAVARNFFKRLFPLIFKIPPKRYLSNNSPDLSRGVDHLLCVGRSFLSYQYPNLLLVQVVAIDPSLHSVTRSVVEPVFPSDQALV